MQQPTLIQITPETPQETQLQKLVRDIRIRTANTNISAAESLKQQRELGDILRRFTTLGINELGITRYEAQKWSRLALIEEDEFEEYLAATIAKGKEVTLTNALKLAPKQQRAKQTNLFGAHDWAVPSIDIQIAIELGYDVGDGIAELILASIENALVQLSEESESKKLQAMIWARCHGINDDGTLGEKWTLAKIAALIGHTREYVGALYYRGGYEVRGHIAISALNALKILIASGDLPS